MWFFHVTGALQGTRDHADERSVFRPTFEPTSPRAKGLKLHVSNESLELDRTVEFIRENCAPDERIFVICGDQVIYFLSERDSILPKENYFTYLSNFKFIDSESDARLTDAQIVQELIARPPRFVIQKRNDRKTDDFFTTWPRTASHIGRAYSRAVEFGQFQVLELRGSRPAGKELE